MIRKTTLFILLLLLATPVSLLAEKTFYVSAGGLQKLFDDYEDQFKTDNQRGLHIMLTPDGAKKVMK